mmetsp:Transcript_53988/g.135695  ORF Transcript_53988/g.135695 Transcript_53988/m.135695 type:complete len:373 (-) Transcript_53988:1424-2542(-)
MVPEGPERAPLLSVAPERTPSFRERLLARWRASLAYVSIALMVGSWLLGGYMLKWIQSAGSEASFSKPFFIAYVTQASFALLYPCRSIESTKSDDRSHHASAPPPLVNRIKQALVLGCMVVAYRSMWALSLASTPVSVNSAIFQTQVLWVYLLSLLVLREACSWLKGLCVVGGFVGVLLMTVFHDNRDGTVPTTVLGCVEVLASACVYSSYAVLMKKWVVRGSTLELVAFQGFFMMLVCWPVFIVLHLTNIEPFQLPTGLNLLVVLALTIEAILYYVFFALALRFGNAVLVALSQMVILPLTAFLDYLIYGYLMDAASMCGAVCILAAFSIMTWADLREGDRRGGGAVHHEGGSDLDTTVSGCSPREDSSPA